MMSKLDVDMCMDERQQRIFDTLTEKHRDLANMYRSALSLLSETHEKVDSRTRISYICHSMREVMNRVLGVMGAIASPGIKPPSEKQVQNLPNIISLYPDLALDGEGESIPVPQGIAVIFDKLIKTAILEKRRRRDYVASLLTDDGNSEHAVVNRWIDSNKFFVKWAHLDDEQVDQSELPSDDLIWKHVRVFDELLNGVLTAFFTRRRLVDDLLAEINAPDEEGDDE